MQGNEPAQAVVLQDLHKSFGQQTVLNGIDLKIAKGDTLVVLGRSGTGKSVLLKLIIGLQKSDSGSIRIHGKEIAGVSMDELDQIRKKVGFLFQEAALYDSLSIEENVAFPLARNTKMSQAEQKDRVRQLLSSVGMEKDLAKMPSQISGGMKKRVGLARALALEPDIMLFDEPTAGLDPITSNEINDLILKLQKEQEMTSIVVTHDLHSAKAIASRVALLHVGDILMEGTFDELQKSKEPFVSQFVTQGS